MELIQPIETIYTLEQAKERLLYWQHKLRLQDWFILIDIVRGNQMPESLEADINYIPDNKQAKIQLCDPIDYPEGTWFALDMDWLIVHELLHLHFYEFKTEDNIRFIEQSIESITHGLMAVERK